MKSKANIKGHPIHPMLIPFPIAFFTGTFILDAVAFISNKEVYESAAYYLEMGGIIFAVMTAIPGIIDYVFTVPPKSSGFRRATKHGLLNIAMLFIFIIAFSLRHNPEIRLVYILGLEGIGVVILTIAGWLGGTLVHRNQIGIDHRYAHAGKWNEERIKTSSHIVELSNLDKLKLDQMKLFHLNKNRIVIARTEEGLVAFEDHCSHRGGSLADGIIICGTIQCPWHGSQFDIKTGMVKAGPAYDKIKIYPLKQENHKVLIEI